LTELVYQPHYHIFVYIALEIFLMSLAQMFHIVDGLSASLKKWFIGNVPGVE